MRAPVVALILFGLTLSYVPVSFSAIVRPVQHDDESAAQQGSSMPRDEQGQDINVSDKPQLVASTKDTIPSLSSHTSANDDADGEASHTQPEPQEHAIRGKHEAGGYQAATDSVYVMQGNQIDSGANASVVMNTVASGEPSSGQEVPRAGTPAVMAQSEQDASVLAPLPPCRYASAAPVLWTDLGIASGGAVPLWGGDGDCGTVPQDGVAEPLDADTDSHQSSSGNAHAEANAEAEDRTITTTTATATAAATAAATATAFYRSVQTWLDGVKAGRRGPPIGSVHFGSEHDAPATGQIDVPGMPPGGFAVFPASSPSWQGDQRGAAPASVDAGAAPLPPSVPLLWSLREQMALYRRVLVVRVSCLGDAPTALLEEALAPDRSKGMLVLLPPKAAWSEETRGGWRRALRNFEVYMLRRAVPVPVFFALEEPSGQAARLHREAYDGWECRRTDGQGTDGSVSCDEWSACPATPPADLTVAASSADRAGHVNGGDDAHSSHGRDPWYLRWLPANDRKAVRRMLANIGDEAGSAMSLRIQGTWSTGGVAGSAMEASAAAGGQGTAEGGAPAVGPGQVHGTADDDGPSDGSGVDAGSGTYEAGAAQSTPRRGRKQAATPPLAAVAVEARVGADMSRKGALARRLTLLAQQVHQQQQQQQQQQQHQQQQQQQGSGGTKQRALPRARPGIIVLGAQADCVTSAAGVGSCSSAASGIATWAEGLRALGVPLLRGAGEDSGSYDRSENTQRAPRSLLAVATTGGAAGSAGMGAWAGQLSPKLSRKIEMAVMLGGVGVGGAGPMLGEDISSGLDLEGEGYGGDAAHGSAAGASQWFGGVMHVHTALPCDAPWLPEGVARACELLDFLALAAGLPLKMHRTAVPVGGMDSEAGPGTDASFRHPHVGFALRRVPAFTLGFEPGTASLGIIRNVTSASAALDSGSGGLAMGSGVEPGQAGMLHWRHRVHPRGLGRDAEDAGDRSIPGSSNSIEDDSSAELRRGAVAAGDQDEAWGILKAEQANRMHYSQAYQVRGATDVPLGNSGYYLREARQMRVATRKSRPLAPLIGAAQMVPHPTSLLDSWALPAPYPPAPFGQRAVDGCEPPPEGRVHDPAARTFALARFSLALTQALLWDDGEPLPWERALHCGAARGDRTGGSALQSWLWSTERGGNSAGVQGRGDLNLPLGHPWGYVPGVGLMAGRWTPEVNTTGFDASGNGSSAAGAVRGGQSGSVAWMPRASDGAVANMDASRTLNLTNLAGWHRTFRRFPRDPALLSGEHHPLIRSLFRVATNCSDDARVRRVAVGSGVSALHPAFRNAFKWDTFTSPGLLPTRGATREEAAGVLGRAVATVEESRSMAAELGLAVGAAAWVGAVALLLTALVVPTGAREAGAAWVDEAVTALLAPPRASKSI